MSDVPKTIWAEPDGDEILIHNGDLNLEGLIATGYLYQYTLTNTIPSPEALIRAALEAAAATSYRTCAEIRHLPLAHRCDARIRALADDPDFIARIIKAAEVRG